MVDGLAATESGATGLYERDFYAWTQQQAEALRRAAAADRPMAALDLENLAEEIESLGRSEKRELRSRLATIIEHLAKLEVSPASEPRAGWMATVRRERQEIERLLEDSPSLRREAPDFVNKECPGAVKRVVLDLRDRGEATQALLAKLSLSYDAEQVPGDWWPESAEGRGQ